MPAKAQAQVTACITPSAAVNWPVLTIINNLQSTPYYVVDSHTINQSRYYRVIPGP